MRQSRLYTFLCAVSLGVAASFLIAPPEEAEAFCGFYVSGAGEEMFNNATMVVMMREGTKTVLSMRNNYEGPPEDFAMVIPVPQVLEEEDVKTLKDDLFDKVDKLAAPRLVEYWEQDPCNQYDRKVFGGLGGLGMRGSGRGGGGYGKGSALGVKVEAEFDVDEYNVAILSAKESTGLETWLKENNYKIPEGAAPVLKPYVEQGLYFFVARVDPKKIEFNKEGMAELSPLRFAYDSKDFFLPVRLGLLNAKGHQDLIVHILAKNARYEVANYNNVTIPTNLIVKQSVGSRFANFYVSLFDRVLEENPGSVVTEYSWNSGTCDPCPGPTLSSTDLSSLGQDYIDGSSAGSVGGGFGWNPWTLTRLHARYTEKDLNEDLIFRKAEAIAGGRGMPYGMKVLEDGFLGEQRAIPAPTNNFQGRYIMLNKWEGEIKCENPKRGVWGGNPKGGGSAGGSRGVAKDTAFAKRVPELLPKMLVTQDVPMLGQVKGSAATSGDSTTSKAEDPKQEATEPEKVDDQKKEELPAEKAAPKSGCNVASGAEHSPGHPGSLWLLAAGLLGGVLMRRRR